MGVTFQKCPNFSRGVESAGRPLLSWTDGNIGRVLEVINEDKPHTIKGYPKAHEGGSQEKTPRHYGALWTACWIMTTRRPSQLCL